MSLRESAKNLPFAEYFFFTEIPNFAAPLQVDTLFSVDMMFLLLIFQRTRTADLCLSGCSLTIWLVDIVRVSAVIVGSGFFQTLISTANNSFDLYANLVRASNSCS